MRHLLVPAHIKWEHTLKRPERERDRDEAGQDKVGGSKKHWSEMGGAKKGSHSFMFDHVCKR